LNSLRLYALAGACWLVVGLIGAFFFALFMALGAGGGGGKG